MTRLLGIESTPESVQYAYQDTRAEERDLQQPSMIRKLASGQYRLYSRKVNPRTGRRRNLGTFGSRAAAEKHEREVQYFKRHP
jgi:hypothetical protein